MNICKGDENIDSDYKTIVIAEISANHEQDQNKAYEMINVAKGCGADVVKFQAYTPDTMTINSIKPHFMVKHDVWAGQTLYKLYKKAYTPWDWFPDLKKYCDDIGIAFLCTAYDKSSVDMLEALDVETYKIASFELVDIPFLEYVGKTNKNVIMSIGMGNIGEVLEAFKAVNENQDTGELALLKCVSNYPTDPSDMNLRTIPNMKELFGCTVGISDHTLGVGVSIAAVALGAEIIEKHFTLSRAKDKSPDSFFSIEPDDLKMLVSQTAIAREALGSVRYGLPYGESTMKSFRRSLFVVKDMYEDQAFSEKNVRSIRPSNGLPPKYLPIILGRKASEKIEKGTPLSWDLIS